MKFLSHFFSFTALVLSMASLANAQVLINYNVNGLTTTAATHVSATALTPGVSGLDLTRGSGLGATGLTNGFSADNWSTSTNLSGAISQNEYYQFGVRIDDGYTASLSTLDLSLRRSAAGAPSYFQILGSTDGFASSFDVGSFRYRGRTSGTAPAVNPLATNPFYYMTNDLAGRPNAVSSVGDAIPTMDLSAVSALQDLAGGTEVTLRLYAWGEGATMETSTVALGRVVGPSIGGTVSAVPEPASVLLIGAAAASGCVLRIRRRSFSKRKNSSCVEASTKS